MIFDFLFYIFKKRFIELSTKEIFMNQKKPDYLAKTEFVFIDSNGKRYFRFPEQSDIPIERWAKIQEKLALISMGMNQRELDQLIDFADLSFNLKKPDWKGVGYAIQEMSLRRKMIVHKELFFDLMGCLLIREDQQPHIWDNETEEKKVEQFKKDVAAGGLADFFDKARLGEFIPYLSGIKDELPQLLEQQDKLCERMNQNLKAFTLELESLTGENQ